MNKKLLLLFIIFFTVGFGVYYYRTPILNSLNPITQPLQSAITQIQTAWANIPEPYKGYANLGVVGGIPAALMMFFAWTKTRAMQKLEETKQWATQQVTDFNTRIQSVTDERNTKIQELEAQLTNTSNPQLESWVTTLQQTIQDKDKEIEKLIAERNEAERVAKALMPKEEVPKTP